MTSIRFQDRGFPFITNLMGIKLLLKLKTSFNFWISLSLKKSP